jgi:hypothetical protein
MTKNHYIARPHDGEINCGNWVLVECWPTYKEIVICSDKLSKTEASRRAHRLATGTGLNPVGGKTL